MSLLPVGIQSFETIRKDGYIYVDKTKHIYDLVSGKKGRYFFLSRPRRFGKSLLVSTLNELFLGNQQLFEGLWINKSDYSWKKHSVIYLDFSSIVSSTPDELRIDLSWELDQIGLSHNVDLSTAPSPEAKFKLLITRLSHEKRVAILIDEYDKPLLQHINNFELMSSIQTILRSFYTIIKAFGSKIHFLFMTGVTKFSKTSVFSGMNNLIDLSLSDDAADLLGYTESEIDEYFQPHMQEIAQLQGTSVTIIKESMRHWYNGYQFSERLLKVYNPFSLLMYLLSKKLRNYWFETGTPSFLIHLIEERNYDIEDLEGAEINIDNLSSYDIDKMRLVPLLLQAGYLTFKSYNPITGNFKLGYPNEETKASFLLNFMETLAKINTEVTKNKTLYLTEALKIGDLEQFFSIFKAFLASVPYDIHIKKEQYYQSIFYIVLSLFGAYIDVEVTTNNGRIDCTVITDIYIYIFEFKLTGTSVQALQQIERKEYYQKFLHDGKVIILVGVSFDKIKRNIKSWVSRELA